jgi:protein gp37
MYRDKKRFGQNPRRIVKSKTTFSDPLKWTEAKLIFTCSWSDWFIDEADDWRNAAWDVIRATPQHNYQILTKRPERISGHLPNDWGKGWKNVWLGVSIENQKHVDRAEILRSVPAHIRFISAEPLLGPIEFVTLNGIHWVITGGESGPNSRSMDLSWVRSIRKQCYKSKTAFFHKQNGGTRIINGAWGGRELDGRTWDAIPVNLNQVSDAVFS